MWAAIKAVQEIHAKEVAHRDIKMSNILVGMDMRLYLCDFSGSLNVTDMDHVFND